jgi:hypothetical protein
VDDVPRDTSVFALKEKYARKWKVNTDKVKLLYAKKPVSDSKTMADIVGDGELDGEVVEFNVMLMGGVTPGGEKKVEKVTKPSVAVGLSGKDMLGTDEFWDDLKGFLVQRLKDEDEGERLAKVFKKTVESESK